jgi:GH15 family glucan-1,4-alpha-glucosidase
VPDPASISAGESVAERSGRALARTGRRREATELFDALIDLGRPLGLYAEQADPVSRHALGNIPQALSHATLVQAALALRDAPRS